ncbi:MAG TPA: hypothetical protein VLL52_20995, partial [Anaerolineae bacterium]|nr:hypothetical protein [Anaerolineae bacterium]
MKQSTKRIIFAVALLQIIIALGLIALPSVVEAIPGRIRANARFPAALNELALTPVPTALPAPSQLANVDTIVIPTRIPPTATPEPTATPTAIPTTMATPEPTIPPTATPEPTATATPL